MIHCTLRNRFSYKRQKFVLFQLKFKLGLTEKDLRKLTGQTIASTSLHFYFVSFLLNMFICDCEKYYLRKHLRHRYYIGIDCEQSLLLPFKRCFIAFYQQIPEFELLFGPKIFQNNQLFFLTKTSIFIILHYFSCIQCLKVYLV